MADTKTSPRTARHSTERRSEPRFPSKGLADLVVISPPRFERVTGTVVDVSRTGFQLDMEDPIEPGARIEIRLKEFIISGVVINCRNKGKQGYHVGVRTVEVLESPSRSRHLLEGDVEPYVAGQGLSAAQREQYDAHVALCPTCQEKITLARNATASKAVLRPRKARKSS